MQFVPNATGAGVGLRRRRRRDAGDAARAAGPLPMQRREEWDARFFFLTCCIQSYTRHDVVSFHSYADSGAVREAVRQAARLGRPVLCTEWLARTGDSHFRTVLPVLHRHGVGAFARGLVNGRTQTQWAWDSWLRDARADPQPWPRFGSLSISSAFKPERRNYCEVTPLPWHHDVLRQQPPA
eukprot:gene34041-biopygen17093